MTIRGTTFRHPHTTIPLHQTERSRKSNHHQKRKQHELKESKKDKKPRSILALHFPPPSDTNACSRWSIDFLTRLRDRSGAIGSRYRCCSSTPSLEMRMLQVRAILTWISSCIQSLLIWAQGAYPSPLLLMLLLYNVDLLF